MPICTQALQTWVPHFILALGPNSFSILSPKVWLSLIKNTLVRTLGPAAHRKDFLLSWKTCPRPRFHASLLGRGMPGELVLSMVRPRCKLLSLWAVGVVWRRGGGEGVDGWQGLIPSCAPYLAWVGQSFPDLQSHWSLGPWRQRVPYKMNRPKRTDIEEPFYFYIKVYMKGTLYPPGDHKNRSKGPFPCPTDSWLCQRLARKWSFQIWVCASWPFIKLRRLIWEFKHYAQQEPLTGLGLRQRPLEFPRGGPVVCKWSTPPPHP